MSAGLDTQLSERQREILTRVVEEYVATSAPVGSKLLVERAGFDVSASTLRAELAELERLGLLTHPHTSAGRVPTEAGYRVYVDGLLARQEPRPAGFPLELATTRSEVDEALQATTEMLSKVTRLLALVSAPPLEAATVRHVDVLQLQPNVVVVVVITSTGGVTKQRYAFPEAVDPGLVTWAGDYLRERLIGLRLRSRLLARAFDEPGFSPRERAFLAVLRSAFDDVEDDRELYVGGAAGLLDELRSRGDRRLPQPDRGAREARGPARRPRPVARAAPAVRAGRRRARAVRACTGSRSSGRPTATPTSRSARSACSGRCAWTTRRRSARSGRPPTSSRGSSKRSTRTSRSVRRPPGELCLAWHHVRLDVGDRTRLLRAARRLPDGERAGDQEGVPPAGAGAPPRRLRASRGGGPLPRGVRGLRGALERRDAPALRPLRPCRASLGRLPAEPVRPRQPRRPLLRRSSARTCSAAGRGARRGARRRRRRRGRRSISSRRRAGSPSPCPRELATTCERCNGQRRRARLAGRHLPPLRRAAAGCSRSRAASSASSSARSACPDCDGSGQKIEHPCESCDGAGRTLERREIEVEVPAGIHDGQRIRLPGEGHAGSPGGRAGDVYVEIARAPRRALRP